MTEKFPVLSAGSLPLPAAEDARRERRKVVERLRTSHGDKKSGGLQIGGRLTLPSPAGSYLSSQTVVNSVSFMMPSAGITMPLT